MTSLFSKNTGSRQLLVDHPLKNGRLCLEREQQSKKMVLYFSVDMEVNHPANTIFEQLILGLTDSEKSWLWPIEFEYSPERLAGGVSEGCILKMVYKVPRFDKPEIPAKPVCYSYRLTQYKPDQCLFEYTGIDHPLKGGAVVQVLAVDDGRSRLKWRGAYEQDGSQDLVINSIIQYFPLLYDTIEEKIIAAEV